MILLAKTQPKDHANGALGLWWAEYRVRDLTEAERAAKPEHLWHRGMLFVLEQRYCNEQDSEFCTVHKGEWQHWDFGQTREEAVNSCAGDSHYTEAESLHPMHSIMVERFKASKARDARIQELREQTHYQNIGILGNPGTWAEVNVVADERERAERDFERELKAARLFTAASNGTAPQGKVDAIKGRVRERYEGRLVGRKAEHARLME